MTSPERILEICETLVAQARRQGATAADAHAQATRSHSVEVRLGRLEGVDRSESAGVTLRVFDGQRSASVDSSELDPGAAGDLVARALAMARAAPVDPHAGLAPVARPADAALDLVDPDAAGIDALRDAALAAEDAARAVPGVTNSDGAGASASHSVMALATSAGFSGVREGTLHSLSASVIAGTGAGMQTDYAARSARYRADLPDAAAIGTLAGTRAVAKLSPASDLSGTMPVVFAPRAGSGLVGILLAAMSARAAATRSTFLLGREDEPLFDSAIRLREDPHRPRGLRSRSFDGEGTPCTPRDLVAGGRTTGWLTNVASAAQLGLPLTGHATRGGGAPGIGASNVWMEPGTLSPEALIADIADGLWVEGMFGNGINLVTGDLSRGIHGRRIRDGQLAEAVAEVTIAGFFPDMMRALTPADDLEFERAVDVPTLRIDAMRVAGS